jgi:hypothetical protein
MTRLSNCHCFGPLGRLTQSFTTSPSPQPQAQPVSLDMVSVMLLSGLDALVSQERRDHLEAHPIIQ